MQFFGSGAPLTVNQDFVVLENIELINTDDGNGLNYALVSEAVIEITGCLGQSSYVVFAIGASGSVESTLDNCISRPVGPNRDGIGYYVAANGIGGRTLTNCMAVPWTDAGTITDGFSTRADNSKLYNCTCAANSTGLNFTGGALDASNNASFDGTAVGTLPQINIDTADFVNTSIGDYNPASGGQLAGTGTSPPLLEFDIVNYPNNDPSEIGPYAIQGVGPVAPILTTDTTTGETQTTAIIGCTTDTAGGTLFWMVSTNVTETDVAIKAGGGADSGNLVPVLGVNGGISVTGLVADTDYYNHWVQEGP
jgi:hypothetical protein